MSQPTLFDVGPARPTKPRVVKQTPVWTNNTTRVTCYDCIAQLAAGQFITPMRAQWKRTAGTETGSYCYDHATPRRDADHLAERNAAA